MKKRHRRREDDFAPSPKPKRKPKPVPTRLRIVAGVLRGRKIEYNGDPLTRPMKERTREAVFSLLGGDLTDMFALDLFGGTGILAFESVSRGADGAVVLEMARPAVKSILSNLQLLELGDYVEVRNVDTLRWLGHAEQNTQDFPRLPWVVYCCPPYRMWHTAMPALAHGLRRLYALSPPGSQFVCETEEDIDLPASLEEFEWDVRRYTPASIAITRKPHEAISADIEDRVDAEDDGGPS